MTDTKRGYCRAYDKDAPTGGACLADRSTTCGSTCGVWAPPEAEPATEAPAEAVAEPTVEPEAEKAPEEAYEAPTPVAEAEEVVAEVPSEDGALSDGEVPPCFATDNPGPDVKCLGCNLRVPCLRTIEEAAAGEPLDWCRMANTRAEYGVSCIDDTRRDTCGLGCMDFMPAAHPGQESLDLLAGPEPAAEPAAEIQTPPLPARVDVSPDDVIPMTRRQLDILSARAGIDWETGAKRPKAYEQLTIDGLMKAKGVETVELSISGTLKVNLADFKAWFPWGITGGLEFLMTNRCYIAADKTGYKKGTGQAKAGAFAIVVDDIDGIEAQRPTIYQSDIPAYVPPAPGLMFATQRAPEPAGTAGTAEPSEPEEAVLDTTEAVLENAAAPWEDHAEAVEPEEPPAPVRQLTSIEEEEQLEAELGGLDDEDGEEEEPEDDRLIG
jgi:hypothetical protein